MQKLSFFKKVFDFFIFSNIFISLCAMIMIVYTWYIFHIEQQPNFLLFIFFATMASYSLHLYFTNADDEITEERAAWLRKNKQIHIILFITSCIVSLYYLSTIARYWMLIAPLIILTFLYTAPKLPHRFFKLLESRIIGKTILLSVVWTYATAVLPLLISQQGWTWQQAFFCFHRFTLIFPIAILFDIRDKKYDKQTGIKSIVTLLPEKTIEKIFNIFIALHILSSVVFLRLLHNSTIAFSFLFPSIITYLLYPHAIKSTNAYLFYFILDGLLILAPVFFFFINFLSHTIL